MECCPPTKAAIKAVFLNYLRSSNIWCTGRLTHTVTFLSLSLILACVAQMQYPKLVKAFRHMPQQTNGVSCSRDRHTMALSPDDVFIGKLLWHTAPHAHTDAVTLTVVHSEDLVTLIVWQMALIAKWPRQGDGSRENFSGICISNR
jgi:hypothetical protein